MSGQFPPPTAFVVIDGDVCRRNDAYRLLSSISYTVPMDSVAELTARTQRAIIFLYDDGHSFEEAQLAVSAWTDYCPIVLYCETIRPDRVVSAVQAGAASYCIAPLTAASVREVLGALSARLDRIARIRASQMAAVRQIDLLTVREREVLEAIHCGMSNKEIARSKQISPRTVEIHRANLIAKLGVQNAVGAVRLWIAATSGIIEQAA